MNKLSYIIIALLALMPFTAEAQEVEVNPSLIHDIWKAYWLSVAPEKQTDYGVYVFRKTARLDSVPSRYLVHVSADNRFILYVNGRRVGMGPSLGDIRHWYYETFDLAPYLQKGDNEVRAWVWNDGEGRPVHQFSAKTAFIMLGDDKRQKELNTNQTWEYLSVEGYAPLKPVTYKYYALGPGEALDMRRTAQVLAQAEQGKGWQKVVMLGTGVPAGAFTVADFVPWRLMPSRIPCPTGHPQRLSRVRLATGVAVPKAFPRKAANIVIPANTTATILLDQDSLTNAFPHLLMSGGKDARLTMGYAESLFETMGGKKGNRNEVEGKVFYGKTDSLVCNGLSQQEYVPLEMRTYRYIQLKVTTAGEALTISDLWGETVGYPFSLRASFHSADATSDSILQNGWRTARLCAIDTYFDCPYYEQLQYFGDTRIQALVSYFNAGDDRLARKAIEQAEYSRIPEGITMSRYPSSQVHFIPTYSLSWVAMLHDFYKYRGDKAFVAEHLSGMHSVLDFFHHYQTSDGTLKNLPEWNFTDWPDGNHRGWKFGVAPLGKDGSSSVLDLQLMMAYLHAADLEEGCGEKFQADIYRKRAAQIKNAMQKYWVAERGLFANNTNRNSFCQHANILAIICGVVEGKAAYDLYTKLTSGKSDITLASIYFKYYLNEAMTLSGHGNDYLSSLGIWKQNLGLGLSTWAEDSGVETARSDCHAWGASPNIEYYRTVLGIDAAAPGFTKVTIAPNPGSLRQLSGTIPTPQGDILVSYKLKGKKWAVSVTLPKSVTGTLRFCGSEQPLHKGTNELSIINQSY